MDGWTLEYKGEEKPFGDFIVVSDSEVEGWGLQNLNLTFTNQSLDFCTFDQQSANFGDTPIFDEGENVIIRLDGVRYFYGRLRAPQRQASAGGEGFAWRVEGPWYWLTKIIFRQAWQVFSNAADSASELVTKYSGRLFLGQKVIAGAWYYQTTAEQIVEIIQWAITQGATMSLDTADIPVIEIPVMEVRNAFCSECVIKMLQLSPDAVTWFDYTTSPYPTLRIKKRKDLTAVNLSPSAGVNITNLTAVPRDDLEVSGVVVEYERTGNVNGVQIRDMTYDLYPIGITGVAPNTLVATVNLEGSNVNYATAAITTAPIYNEVVTASPAGTAIASMATAGTPTLNWWKSKRPDLAKITADPNNPYDHYIRNLKIRGISRTGTLANELLTGQYAPWMGGHFADETIEALASYEVVQKVNDVEAVREVYIDELLSVKIKTTSLSGGTYYSAPDPSSSYGEAVPTGLAQYLYEATAVKIGDNIVRQYDGNVTITERECSRIRVGNTLNLLAGAPAEFATMYALIQEVTLNAESGSTQIRFGPPKHLGPDDLMEMIRGLRQRMRYTPLAARTTGRGGISGNTELGSQTSKESHTTGKAGRMIQTWYDPTLPTGVMVKVDIDVLKNLLTTAGLTVAQIGTIQPQIIECSKLVNGACVSGRMVIWASNFVPNAS